MRLSFIIEVDLGPSITLHNKCIRISRQYGFDSQLDAKHEIPVPDVRTLEPKNDLWVCNSGITIPPVHRFVRNLPALSSWWGCKDIEVARHARIRGAKRVQHITRNPCVLPPQLRLEVLRD